MKNGLLCKISSLRTSSGQGGLEDWAPDCHKKAPPSVKLTPSRSTPQPLLCTLSEGKNHFSEVQCRSMVSLEELVSLVTRGTPVGDFTTGGGEGGVDTGATPGGESKARDADEGVADVGPEGGVQEVKTADRPSSAGGDAREHNQQDSGAGDHDDDRAGVLPPTQPAAQPGRPSSEAGPSPPAPPPGLVRAASSTHPPSSWFRSGPDDLGGGARGERPLPSEVRWAFMWLLDSVFFSVKQPVEGLDRHPSVQALLENILAVRARCLEYVFRLLDPDPWTRPRSAL